MSTKTLENIRIPDPVEASDACFRLLFFANPQPMWIVDCHTFQFLEVNDACVAHYGYSREEFLKMTGADIRPKEDIARFNAVNAGHMPPVNVGNEIPARGSHECGTRSAGRWRHLKKDGSLITVEVTRHPLEWNGHQAQMAVLNDITETLQANAERKQSYEALRNSEMRFRAVFDNSVSPIAVTRNNQLVTCNKAYAALFAYPSPERLLTLPFDTIILPEERELFAKRLNEWEVKGEDKPLVCETVGESREGKRLTLELKVAAYWQEGERYRVVMPRDISDQKKREAQASYDLMREKRITRTLQRTLLLTTLPEEFEEVEVATFYTPAQSGDDPSLVGGDFYDVFAVDGERVAFVVGDVLGKGLAAAARTAEAKYVLRATMRAEKSVAAAVSSLSDHICAARRLDSRREVGSATFVALTVVTLNRFTGEGITVQAGAEPPFILRSNGKTELPLAGGMPLGVFSGEEYSEGQFQLGDSDVLLLSTDGLIEVRPAVRTRMKAGREEAVPKFLGPDGLARLASDAMQNESSRLLSRIGQTLLDSVRDFGGFHFRDDVCMLLARRR